jgi:putative addiction module component (TIGR02574 family)
MDVQSTKYAIIEKIILTEDENLLNEVKAILAQEEEILLTDLQNAELDRRSLRHKNGESKSYTWEEVKQRARAQK